MFIKSPIFENDGNIPKEYSCDGSGLRPELQIGAVPNEAKSLAIIMYDPDAPMEGGFTHWMVWNINPKTSLIKSDDELYGCVQGLNSAKKIGYIAPCPRNGEHHYVFYLFALNFLIDLKEDASFSALDQEIKSKLISKTELVGIYDRKI
jgi:Raf kinase inhibitor-like YbhB/YbcL family protein